MSQDRLKAIKYEINYPLPSEIIESYSFTEKQQRPAYTVYKSIKILFILAKVENLYVSRQAESINQRQSAIIKQSLQMLC